MRTSVNKLQQTETTHCESRQQGNGISFVYRFNGGEAVWNLKEKKKKTSKLI